MEGNTLVVLVKEQYGNVRYFPHNETAQKFLKLVGNNRSTLTEEELILIRELGFKITRKNPLIDEA